MQLKMGHMCGFTLLLLLSLAGCSRPNPKPVSLTLKTSTRVFHVCRGREREIADPDLRERLLDAIRAATPTKRKSTPRIGEWISLRDGKESFDLVLMRVGPTAEVYWEDTWYESGELYDILENEVDNLRSRKFTPP